MLGDSEIMAFVSTTDLKRSLPFYRDVLDLTLIESSPFANVFRAGSTILRVTEAAAVDPAPYTVLGWIVEDIGRVIGGLAERGVEFRRFDGMPQDEAGVWTTPNGDQIAWFPDPDGNLLSLTQFSG